MSKNMKETESPNVTSKVPLRALYNELRTIYVFPELEIWLLFVSTITCVNFRNFTHDKKISFQPKKFEKIELPKMTSKFLQEPLIQNSESYNLVFIENELIRMRSLGWWVIKRVLEFCQFLEQYQRQIYCFHSLKSCLSESH